MQEKWYQKTIDEIKSIIVENGTLDVSFEQKGLSKEQVGALREKYGVNKLETKKKKSLLARFVDQFKDFMIIVLIIAAVVSGVVGVLEHEGFTDSIIILGVVILNAIIGVVQERNAEKSLEALQELSSYIAKVIRNGQVVVVPSEELVVGDIVVLDTGDYIPADLRIIEAVNLKVQEAALTGESVPVEKNINVITGENIAIADRDNMLFSSSLITYGRGKGIVVETGMNTEVGKIAKALDEADETVTPLQQKLNQLGKTLGLGALGICLLLFLVGALIYQKPMVEMFMTAVSLAVAAIPEGLAAVATIVLAVGVQKMVKKHAIVKTLPAVETLGSATVICSDKTGTLTQNKMTVEKIYYNNTIMDVGECPCVRSEGETLTKLIHCAILCNDTKINDDTKELTGDPTETALVELGFKLESVVSIPINKRGTRRRQRGIYPKGI